MFDLFNASSVITSLKYIGGGLILLYCIPQIHFLLSDKESRARLIGDNIFKINLPFWGAIFLEFFDLSLVATMVFSIFFLIIASFGCYRVDIGLKELKEKENTENKEDKEE